MRSAFYGRVTARTTHGKEARNPRRAPSWPTRHTQRMHDRRPRRPGFSSTALDTVASVNASLCRGNEWGRAGLNEVSEVGGLTRLFWCLF
jgi:hypothetical protein